MAKKLTEELFPDVKARQDNVVAKDIAPKETPELDAKAKADAVVASDANNTGWRKKEPEKSGNYKGLSWENLQKGDKVMTLYEKEPLPNKMEDGVPVQDQVDGMRWVNEGEIKDKEKQSKKTPDEYGGVEVDKDNIKKTGKWKSLID